MVHASSIVLTSTPYVVQVNDKLEATVERHREEVEALKAKFAEIVEELCRRHDSDRSVWPH